MAATADQVARIRAMVAEPTTTTYTDSEIEDIIERWPVTDERGISWFVWSSDTPPTKTVNPNWVPSYDLNAAAAEIWEEKAAALAGNMDFTSVNQSFDHSQPYEHAMKQCRWFRSKRQPTSIRIFPMTTTDETPWIANLPEAD